MRILVIADIHANRAALDAIKEPFDACLCLGDLIEYGPHPAECIDWVRTHATACVRGNHDHGAVQDVPVTGTVGFRYLTMASRRVTIPALAPADRRFLADLPTTALVTVGGWRFFLVHASPATRSKSTWQPTRTSGRRGSTASGPTSCWSGTLTTSSSSG